MIMLLPNTDLNFKPRLMTVGTISTGALSFHQHEGGVCFTPTSAAVLAAVLLADSPLRNLARGGLSIIHRGYAHV
jgi:hypothetical protein